MAEKIRFYFDEHVPRAVARGLRRRGVEVLCFFAAFAAKKRRLAPPAGL